jgi:predicted TIM-barrel fold metal-dependent hydrolase
MDKRRIIDSHIHFWDFEAHRDWYPGLGPWAESVGKPGHFRTHMPADHKKAQDVLDVVGVVHVSAITKQQTHLAEDAWLEGVLDTFDGAAVTMGTIDPQAPVDEILRDLDRLGESPRFRGVRVIVDGFEPGSKEAKAILSWLDERHAVYDVLASQENAMEWASFLNNYPNVTKVLEHLGVHGAHGSAGFSAWADHMRQTANETDWLCKFSGLGMHLPDLTPATVEPWLETAVDAWGWDRLVWGSNNPPDTFADDEQTQSRTIVDLVEASADEAQAQAFFHDNADRAYRVMS